MSQACRLLSGEYSRPTVHFREYSLDLSLLRPVLVAATRSMIVQGYLLWNQGNSMVYLRLVTGADFAIGLPKSTY